MITICPYHSPLFPGAPVKQRPSNAMCSWFQVFPSAKVVPRGAPLQFLCSSSVLPSSAPFASSKRTSHNLGLGSERLANPLIW